MLKAHNINRIFGGGSNQVQALKDVNIDILPGRLTILRGRSGSGKTCMINIMGALDKPNSGEVLYEGRDIVKDSENKRDMLRKSKFGFIFQSVALMPMMTAYENVDFALRLAGVSVANRDKRVKECLDYVEMSKRAKHRPAELSGGEQQRVAIARAICHRPSIVFADEPTAELDSRMGLAVMKLMKDLVAHEGLTIVLTTHDPNMFELADDVYTLENGEVTDYVHVTSITLSGALAVEEAREAQLNDSL